MRGSREVCLAALVVTMMISWYAVNLHPDLSVTDAPRNRRFGGGVGALHAQRALVANAGMAAAADTAAAHGGQGAHAAASTPGSSGALAAVTGGGAVGAAAGGGGAAAAAAESGAGCPPDRRPYHVIMTAASGKYQEWQSRIAYYHYKKQKALHPCSEMGGFTRLVNLPGGKPDALVAEMPTVVVQQLSGGRREGGDYGFIVMNRPWGVMQLLKTEHWRAIPEEYVLILETDHLFMHPPPNKATPTQPAAFKFYYMNSKDVKLQPVIRKYWQGSFDEVDPVGPSPAIMTKAMLERITPAWWDYSLRMKRDDPDANREFGWVLEMWGYTLGVLSLGIHHIVDPEFQGTGMDGMHIYPIYHYTFDIRTDTVWSVSKRTFHGRYFPRNYRMPPPCSSESHFALAGMFNEASANLPGWEGDDAKGDSQPWPARTDDWRNDYSVPPSAADAAVAAAATTPGHWPTPLRPTDPAFGAAAARGARALLTHAAVGTGPWQWGESLTVYILARGQLGVYSHPVRAVKGGTAAAGRWRFETAADAESGGGDGSAAQAAPLRFMVCGVHYRVTFSLGGGSWTLSATPVEGGGAAVPGVLGGGGPPRGTHAAEAASYESGSLAAQMVGTGPYQWAGMTPCVFLRGGVFMTPWAPGTWGAKPGDPSAIVATFYGIKHELTLSSAECGKLLSMRVSDRDRVPVAFMHEKTSKGAGACQGHHG